jgi:hypothetical protein
MKKSCFLIIITSLLILTNCSQKGTRTEIVVQLSESEFLSTKYPGWFAAGEGIDKEPFDNSMRESLKAELEEKKGEAITVLQKRVEGVCVPLTGIAAIFNKVAITAEALQEENSWLIAINRECNEAVVKELLEKKTGVGFWETYMLSEVWEYIDRANSLLADEGVMEELMLEHDTAQFSRENPLFRILAPMVDGDGNLMTGCAIGNAHFADTVVVNRIFQHPLVQLSLPRDLKLIWSQKPYQGNDQGYYSLIAIKVSSIDMLPLITDEYIVGATVNKERYPPTVNFTMNSEGARIFSRLTAENIDRHIACTMNGKVVFHPRVAMEIKEGNVEISGDFTEAEASEIAILLGSGSMPPFGVKVMSVTSNPQPVTRNP